MRSSPLLSLVTIASLCVSACSAPARFPDAESDASAMADSAATDASSATDAAMDANDASVADDASASSDATTDSNDGSAPTDASAPSDGGPSNTDILGTLYGPCGVLRPLIASPMPSLVSNQVVFMSPERYERAALSMGGQRLFDTPNAGGSSIESEIMAYEVLHFCEGASLTATETEILYAPPDDGGANSITDLLVTINGQRVGVSVTRIYRPAPMVLTDADVRAQLVTKLTGINRSSVRVLPAYRWVKQILSVFVANDTVAEQVTRVWPTIDAATRADTIVLMTATRGGGFIYCNPDPALGAECPSL